MIVLRDKSFAGRDYEGLNNEEKKLLRKERQEYAKSLKKVYRKTMEDVDKFNPRASITTESRFGSPHVRSRVSQETTPGWMDNKSTVDLHKNGFRETVLEKALPDAKDRMKNYARNQAKINAEVGRQKGLERAKERDLVVRRRGSSDLKERLEAYKEKKARAKASAESIAKHEAKAAELRAKKATGILLKRAGTGAAIAAGAAGIGIAAKKLYDKEKKD